MPRADEVDQSTYATIAYVDTMGQVAGGDLTGTYPNPTIADAKVDQATLKATAGEVSGALVQTLPGGEYGFYPRLKANAGNWNIAIFYPGGTLNTFYTTLLQIAGSGGTPYALQRYITSSGSDYWLFLLIDKVTKDIVAAYSAPDHPAYGNGGDFNKVPHPFPNYDETKYEIVLVDNETIAELKAQVTEEKSLLTLVNEDYKVNLDSEEVYKPLHSGKFIDKKSELVQTIPDYIKVRKLIKLTTQELQEKRNAIQLVMQKVEQNRVAKMQYKQNAINKLVNLGLLLEEIEAFKNG